MKKKIDLMLLPFWSPFIPPLGIAMLKSFLQKNGDYQIKTHDLNPLLEFRQVYSKYMELVSTELSKENQGNVNTIGNKVLMYHSLVYLNKDKTNNYLALVKELFMKYFNSDIDNAVIDKFDSILGVYFSTLLSYLSDCFQENAPDVLGLSMFNGNIAASLFVAKTIKEKHPNTLIIVGGGVFSDQLYPEGFNYEKVMGEMSQYIDKVVIGEGEEILLKLIEGKIIENKKIHRSNELNIATLDCSKITTPNFDDFNINLYPQLATLIARSCPFQCGFCSETVHWGKYRKRDVSAVVKEMNELSIKHSRSLFLLGDSLLDPVITDLSNEILCVDRKLYWDGYLRVSKMASEPNNAELWRSAGFYRARLGVESGSNKVLQLMNKGIDKDLIRKTLKNLANSGIKTTTYWIAAFPGETEEDFEETLKLLEELNEYIFSAECHPFEYFLKGQVSSDEWALNQGVETLFSDEFNRVSMLQSWSVKGGESNVKILKRIFNFNNICNKYHISNPHSLSGWYHADKRWKDLHINSVPSFLELQKKIKTSANLI